MHEKSHGGLPCTIAHEAQPQKKDSCLANQQCRFGIPVVTICPDFAPASFNRPQSQPSGMAIQQIKMFKGVDSELPELERQINRWIRKTGVRVLSINGNLASQTSSGAGPMSSFAAGQVLIIVHFEVDKPDSDS